MPSKPNEKKINNQVRTIAKECLLMRTRTLSRAITSIYEKKLLKHGLKASQLNILVTVANFSSIQQKRIGKFFHMEKSSLSRTLVPLEKNGWIRTEKIGVSQKVFITPNGLKLLEKVFIDWQQAQKEVQLLIGPSMAMEMKDKFKLLNSIS
ncbi:MAG TPA: MarR family transcriptional regulator [Leptospiraceae bacterium]|nr:MarR family transcriptional regulator [Leptospiraceae bacterium]HMW05856.1 MarR family transcriptional regulator [Leptospiraceae bacterium]HMX33194.1 MarR family transcriptional regulator [Leptospiraceae bacterium]HMY33643.1 MarR family transcriptional regulator [Leptospiraceae bacterium]HMZ64108.1 MarR family transcriptional regulator [Leptospiraceae bacterium]